MGQNRQNHNQNVLFFFLFVWTLMPLKFYSVVTVLLLPLDENLISPMTFLLTLR